MDRLKIIHQNVDGLHKKKALYDRFLEKYSPDVCCINEVKTKRTLKFKGYNSVRKDRPNQGGGGMLTLVKKGIEFETIDIGNFGPTNEYILINLILEDKSKVQIASVYCPPKNQLNKRLFKNIIKQNRNTIIMGDLNAHLIQNGSKRNCKRGTQVKEIIQEYNLTHKNERQVTYKDYTTGGEDCLDFVLTTDDISRKISKVQTGDNIGSDHDPIMFDVHIKLMRKHLTNIPKFQYSKADWKGFERDINENLRNLEELKEIPTDDEIEKFTGLLTSIIIKSATENIPKTKPMKTTSKAYPEELVKMIKSKSKIRKEYQQTREAAKKSELNNIQKKIKRKIREISDETTILETERLANAHPNSSVFWKELRRLEENKFGTKNDVPPIIINDKSRTEKFAYTDEEKCEKFAEHLSNVFQIQDDKNFDKGTKTEVDKNDIDLKQKFKTLEPSFNGALTKQINMKELKSTLKKVLNGKASGEDKIQNEMLKKLPKLALDNLKALFNKVVKTGYYPKLWKSGIITMIHKKKKPDQLTTSYRPICLTSQLGKLLEKIIAKRLQNYAEQFNLIHPNQAGYRKGKSTTDHLVRLISSIEKGFYKDRQHPKLTAALFIDIEKAFDSIWHEALIFKLQKAGLSLADLKLITSYLHRRTYKVRVNSSYSKLREIEAGVPQGGILSPILFLIFTNDIPQRQLKRNDISDSLFADDIDAWATHTDQYMLTFMLQVAAHVYQTWSNKWRLKLNPSKCSIVVFKLEESSNETNEEEDNNRNQVPVLNVKINGQRITNKKEEKFLGLTLDSHLTFGKHMENVISTCRHRLNLIRSLRWKNIISKQTTMRLYETLIFSKISYGIPAWLHLSQKQRKKLQVQQNDVLRLSNKVTRAMRRRILEMHDDANLPLVKEKLEIITRNYFTRKSEDPLLLEVKENCNDRMLTKIGWHRITSRLIGK